VSTPGDDAQRELERKALRNVRGLLDKVEEDERLTRRGAVRIAVIAVVVALVATAIVVVWMSARRTADTANPVVIPAPPKGAPQ
jgi:hypothetical protein